MFFAAFEKKWWKSSDSKSENSNGSEANDVAAYDTNNQEDIDGIEEAALNTATSDWIEGEEKVDAEQTKDFEELSEDDSDDEEVFTNSDNYEQVDPHAPPAFDLDDKDDEFQDEFEDTKNSRRKPKIGSIKEFFNTEILYRYDIMEDVDRDELKGDYRIELTGQDSSTWSLSLSRDISISNERNNAPVVLKLDSNDFLSIVNGKLNCQIALVSKRVKIEGDTKKASLLQNILAPRPE